MKASASYYGNAALTTTEKKRTPLVRRQHQTLIIAIGNARLLVFLLAAESTAIAPDPCRHR